MNLHDLFSLELFEQMLAEKYVRVQTHPRLPLAIINYTEKAQFEHAWNEVTTKARGIIYNTETLEVVARPFDKFFNYGERDPDAAHYSSPVIVTDKMDGSLGILYRDTSNGWGYSIATRGSFTSPQAIHGTLQLRRHLERGWKPDPEFTYLFEIIYPENRIVLDYGNMDELVMLSRRHTEQGWSADGHRNLTALEMSWHGEIVTDMEYATFEEAIRADPRPNKEGVVVYFIHNGDRLKIKQADYVALHRIVTGLNERVVWDMLGQGKTVQQISEPLPDELHAWVAEVAAELQAKAFDIETRVLLAYGEILDKLNDARHYTITDTNTIYDRKEFALLAIKSDYRGLLFGLFDNRDIQPAIWKGLRPEATRSQFAQSEDTA